jgi:hypothetical protein
MSGRTAQIRPNFATASLIDRSFSINGSMRCSVSSRSQTFFRTSAACARGSAPSFHTRKYAHVDPHCELFEVFARYAPVEQTISQVLLDCRRKLVPGRDLHLKIVLPSLSPISSLSWGSSVWRACSTRRSISCSRAFWLSRPKRSKVATALSMPMFISSALAFISEYSSGEMVISRRFAS